MWSDILLLLSRQNIGAADLWADIGRPTYDHAVTYGRKSEQCAI